MATNGFRPGWVRIDVEWDVVGTGRGSWNTSPRSFFGESPVPRERIDSREAVRGSRVIEVQRATPENVARTKEKLELYPPGSRGRLSPSKEVIQCLTGSRHPEFVPLMIRAVQLCGDYSCRELLDTLYDSFPRPATGFERLFPLLEAGDPACRYLFDYWDYQAFCYTHTPAQTRRPGRREGRSAVGQ